MSDHADCTAGALHERVQIRRRTLGLTQDQLADLAGVSTRFVHELEHAKGTVRLDKVRAVLEVLGFDLAVVARRVDTEAGAE